MKKSKKTLSERIDQADHFGNRYLGDFNELVESGYPENGPKAQALYKKGQYWLDQYNYLTGNGDKPRNLDKY